MRRCRQHPSEAGKPHNRPRSPRSRTCYPGTIRRRSASGVSVLVSIWWATRARVARRWREQYDAESGASRQTTSDHPVGADRHVERDAGGHSSAGASGRKGPGSREMPGPGLLRTVGTPHVDMAITAFARDANKPGIAAHLAVLNETSRHVGLDEDLAVLATVRTRHNKSVVHARPFSPSRPLAHPLNTSAQERRVPGSLTT